MFRKKGVYFCLSTFSLSWSFIVFSEIEGFSRAVERKEIEENDYNLNVTLYVFPEEETEEIDVAKEWKELRRLEGELVEIERRIEGYLRELEYWKRPKFSASNKWLDQKILKNSFCPWPNT